MASCHCKLLLHRQPEGGYMAIIPTLPGCVTYGRTLKEARAMARDAAVGYVASLRKHNEPIPSDDKTLVAVLDFEDPLL